MYNYHNNYSQTKRPGCCDCCDRRRNECQREEEIRRLEKGIITIKAGLKDIERALAELKCL